MKESEPATKEGERGDRRITIQIHGCGEAAREISFDFSGRGGCSAFEVANRGLADMIGAEMRRRLGFSTG